MHPFFSGLIIVVFILLQTTILHTVAIEGVVPDLSLIALVFLANKNGKIFGESLGFIGGLVEDFLSLSPLGFHAVVKTLIGYLFGLTHGVVFIGALLMPMLMVCIATLLKSLLVAAVTAFFQIPLSAFSFFSMKTVIELGCNVFLSPFIFAFLGLFRIPKER
jgi:rod shape-determining protein MreD